MNYETFAPSEELSAFIKCYWILEGSKEELSEKQQILPDGCIEMIFHYGDLYRQYFPNGQSTTQPRSFVFGQLTQCLEVEALGKTGTFSVRFHPEGFRPLCTKPLKELNDKAISLQEFFGEEGKLIEKWILEADTTEKRIEIIEDFLIRQLQNSKTSKQFLREAIDIIITANGRLPITVLTEQMRINRRHLERNFSSDVGLSPKQLARIVRLQATLKRLLNNEYDNFTDLAHTSYYDQSHFIKDFKEFTGLTPKQFYGNRFRISTMFYGDE